MTLVLAIFVFVYLGMLLGGIPGLALDRTGVALLGAILLVAFGAVTPEAAWAAIDISTMGLLFGLMVVSAQFRLSGLYSHFTRSIAELDVSPPTLLGSLVLGAGLLSALLANDIVCLAVTPVLIEACQRRKLDPVPFLLGLACAANVGSAATLIGNPQNMLVGQALDLSFGGYLLDAGIPALLGLGIVWGVICWRTGGRWSGDGAPLAPVATPRFDRWQTSKGAVIVIGLVLCFLVTPWPREILALAAAGLLLASRRMHSRAMLGLVDWQLLILFGGLFIVNHAILEASVLERGLAGIRATGIDPADPSWLFVGAAVLSNLVSNVPAVMLLLPLATHPLAGPVLALASTLAGNLIVVGSIANIIVVDQATRQEVRLTWRQHARVGVPVTLVTLTLAAAWLWLRAATA